MVQHIATHIGPRFDLSAKLTFAHTKVSVFGSILNPF